MRDMKKTSKKRDVKLALEHDLLIIFLGIIIAFILAKTGALKEILSATNRILFFDSFVAGLFYTSGFTTPIAFIALFEIAKSYSIFEVALFGAFGAVLGDFLIFRFLRDKLDNDILILIKGKYFFKNLKKIFHLRLFRWVSIFLGGIILATPLPDELGLAILGFSKTKNLFFIIFSFLFKFLSILFIAWVAKMI